MVLPKFEYLAAHTVEEASNLQVELGAGAKLMAGGTDIIPPITSSTSRGFPVWITSPTMRRRV